MKVLITGANGFLGRHVVAAFLRRGHSVRAMVRPAVDARRCGWDERVEVVKADLRHSRNLAEAFAGVDALIHLAATVQGDYETQFAGTVVTTERLLEAMRQTPVRRLVVASSFSVYDWSAIGGRLSEDSPLEADIYTRDAYAGSKLWQERIVRRTAAANGWELTVLRPALIWGRGHPYTGRVGQGMGRVQLVIGPWNRPPLTHVANCADCFVQAAENPKAIGQTFNVVDDFPGRSWGLMGEHRRRGGGRGVRVPLPYWAAMALVRLSHWGGRVVFGPKAKVPSLFVPCRFEARFKPVRCATDRLRDLLEWRPPLGWEECLEETYGIAGGKRSEAAASGATARALAER
jgi:2-alkyl-3-oxoalkanoate reductase